jgi:hypothetical protein
LDEGPIHGIDRAIFGVPINFGIIIAVERRRGTIERRWVFRDKHARSVDMTRCWDSEGRGGKREDGKRENGEEIKLHYL